MFSFPINVENLINQLKNDTNRLLHLEVDKTEAICPVS